MTFAAANFCAINLQTFESITRLGLKIFVQTTLDIGVASNKRFMVDDLLCQQITDKRNIETAQQNGVL